MLAVTAAGRLLSRWLPRTAPAASQLTQLRAGVAAARPPNLRSVTAAAAPRWLHLAPRNAAAALVGDTRAPVGLKIRAGNPATDIEHILAAMPRLASFDVPEWRAPSEMWVGDAEMLKTWASQAHEADGSATTGTLVVLVAEAPGQPLLGLAAVTMQPEFLSGAPGAHLEALLVAEGSEGAGVGRALLAQAEATALARGAETMNLHVFASNARARRLYADTGYNEEILRCIKPLS